MNAIVIELDDARDALEELRLAERIYGKDRARLADRKELPEWKPYGGASTLMNDPPASETPWVFNREELHER